MTVIIGTAPHPGTTFPCPEFPIAFKRVPNAVFCPMVISLNRIYFVIVQELIHKSLTNLPKLMQTLSSAPDPAVSIAVTILALLLALTGFGLWTAFGPKAAKLTDPWDDHDD